MAKAVEYTYVFGLFHEVVLMLTCSGKSRMCAFPLLLSELRAVHHVHKERVESDESIGVGFFCFLVNEGVEVWGAIDS